MAWRPNPRQCVESLFSLTFTALAIFTAYQAQLAIGPQRFNQQFTAASCIVMLALVLYTNWKDQQPPQPQRNQDPNPYQSPSDF